LSETLRKSFGFKFEGIWNDLPKDWTVYQNKDLVIIPIPIRKFIKE
jgi:hypothetical protein